jgi:hypothetical protein
MDMHIPAELRVDSTTLPHVTATDDAEPLQALWDHYRKAAAEWGAANTAHDEASCAARKSYPERGAELFLEYEIQQPDGTTVVQPMLAPESDLLSACTRISEKYGQNSRKAAVARGRVEKYREWEAACRVVDARYKVPELEKSHEKAERLMQTAEKRFVAAQPRSLQGILLKLEYIADIESMRDGGGSSDLLVRRVVLGLIDHLQATMSRDGSNLPFGS